MGTGYAKQRFLSASSVSTLAPLDHVFAQNLLLLRASETEISRTVCLPGSSCWRELFSAQRDVSLLAELREAIELGIFDVLEEALKQFPTNNHLTQLTKLFVAPNRRQIITANYALVVDAALMYLSKQQQEPGGLPNY